MKTIVFLLVLANLLFYAFSAGYFGRPDNPDAGRVEQQVVPERMRIVSRGETPAVPKSKAAAVAAKVEPESPSPPKAEADPSPADKEAKTDKDVKADKETKETKVESVPAGPPVCLSWHQLSVADADRLTALLTKRFGDYQLSRPVAAENGWWVFIPAQASKADADKKAGELQALGVKDFFVIQEGPNRFAISLGVFSAEKGGQERLAELKSKGVRSALTAPRPGKDGWLALQAKGPAGQKTALLAAVGEALPKAEAQGCP